MYGLPLVLIFDLKSVGRTHLDPRWRVLPAGGAMAGTLKSEATLAAANLVFILLLFAGGVIVPLSKFPSAVRPVLDALPISALSDCLRAVLQQGATMPWGDLGVLAVWAVLGLAAAARFFRWE